jgi:hypothetical protein
MTLIFAFLTLFSVALFQSDVLAALRESKPAVQWDATSVKQADVNGDGIQDTIVVGYDTTSVWLGFVPGTKSRSAAPAFTQQFSVGQSQSSFCAKRVHIELHPTDCDGNGRNLPGCKVVKGASEFSLVDGECDSFHFYWDRAKMMLRWWRN